MREFISFLTAGTQEIPFLVESRIKELGGQFEKAPELFGVSVPFMLNRVKRICSPGTIQAHVVVDGNLITGQNPASAKGIGEAIDKALSA